jgi:hypothetical protein
VRATDGSEAWTVLSVQARGELPVPHCAIDLRLIDNVLSAVPDSLDLRGSALWRGAGAILRFRGNEFPRAHIIALGEHCGAEQGRDETGKYDREIRALQAVCMVFAIRGPGTVLSRRGCRRGATSVMSPPLNPGYYRRRDPAAKISGASSNSKCDPESTLPWTALITSLTHSPGVSLCTRRLRRSAESGPFSVAVLACSLLLLHPHRGRRIVAVF